MTSPTAPLHDTATSSNAMPSQTAGAACANPRFGIFPECPLCGGSLHPEHAHYKCGACGWRDSCCD